MRKRYPKQKWKVLTMLLLTLLLTLSTGCSGHDKNVEIAREGLLDLSHIDFCEDRVVKLRGEWEYYWEELLSPGDFKSEDKPALTGYMKFPEIWNSYSKAGSGFGYLTYRLNVKLQPSSPHLALYLHDMNSAYTLYVNGHRLITRGEVGRHRWSTEPLVIPAAAEFRPVGNNLEIVIQVANFHHKYGGPRFNILLGNRDRIYSLKERNLFIDIFLFGGLMIIALYHLVLYLLRKKDRSPLFILICCLLISLRTLLLGEMYFNQLFPLVAWENMIRLELFAFYLVTPFFSLIIYTLFPAIYKRQALYLIFIAGIILTLIAIVGSIHFSLLILPIFQVLTFIYCLYTIYVLVTSVVQRSEGALVTLSGFLIFFFTICNDILYNNNLLETGFFTSYGLFIFILSQAFILSIRSSKAFSTAEHLTKNLKEEVLKQTLMLKSETRKALAAKAQMEKMSVQKSNFFMNLTHETKTPVTLIKNYLGMHIDRHGLTRELKIVARNTDELERNMDNYMQIERAAEVESGLYRHETLISLTKAIEELSTLYPAKTVELKLDTEVNIMANPAAIKRVLDNIMINAVKYNDENIRIEIELTKREDKVILRIADNGVGIPKEQLDNIFNPFYQLSHKKRNIQGIGLGLSLVKKILDSLKATVEVKSDLGQGMEYLITFPQSAAGSRSEEEKTIREEFSFSSPLLPESEPIVTDSSYSPLKESILIVEDKRETLGLLKSILEIDYNVFVAENGLKALERLNKLEEMAMLPSLILSDIMMDSLDGYSLIDSLKNREGLRYIPVVLLSAKSTTADKSEGYNKGAVAYLTKPFSPETLKAVIRSNIESRELLLDDFEKSRFNDRGFSERCNRLGISELQQQIIRYWLVESYSQDEIALKINRSRRMVEKHIKTIKEATGTRSKGDLKKFFSDELA